MPTGCLIVGDKYGVGFDAPDGTPCEHQIPDGFSVGRLAGNQLPRVRIVSWSVNQIGGLHEQTAVNLTELGLGLRRLRHLQDTQVLLLGLEQFKRIGVVIGATMTSVKIGRTLSAISMVTLLFAAITPP